LDRSLVESYFILGGETFVSQETSWFVMRKTGFSWGTNLDYQDKVPTRYVGKSFEQAWHDEIDDFKKLNDDQKWEMAYWIEYQALRGGFKNGLFGGLFLGGLAIYLLMLLF
jgi:hypothetical protein